MNILAIETSCDETAVALLKCEGSIKNPKFEVLGNALNSQIKIHEQYGGVFPMMAKREHAKNLTPLLLRALKIKKSKSKNNNSKFIISKKEKLKTILEREPGLFGQFEKYIVPLKKPKVDLIVVTEGPGLEPALWVGINFARALAALWDIPIKGINHMEGHIASVLTMQNRSKFLINNFQFSKKTESQKLKAKSLISFPALALLISGGHTELVSIKNWGEYKIIGKTRDDAVGEAFDKVARLLNLPYPGGPQISRLAKEARKTVELKISRNQQLETRNYTLPRPMIHSKDLDFSFSGLKTAVLYMVQKIPLMTEEIKKSIAKEFEESITEVLVLKTRKALEVTKAKTLIIAGGVSANKYLRKEIVKLKLEKNINILFPAPTLTSDNAIMIGMAGYMKIKSQKAKTKVKDIKAKGNLSLEK